MTTHPEPRSPMTERSGPARLWPLVHAELIKARGTRSVWAIGAAGVALTIGWAVASVLVFMPASSAPIEARLIDAYSMTGQAYLMAIILGVVVMAGEYRHQTITRTFLVTPKRGWVIAAKLFACGVMGLLLGAACVVVTGTLIAVLLVTSGEPLVAVPGVAGTLLASMVGTGIWAVLGAALGALLRSQVAAIIIAFVWFFYAEWLLIQLLPEVGRWVPSGAARAATGWSRDGLVGFDGAPVPGALLPVWAGALVFVAYVLAATLAARFVSVRRDVT